MHQLDAVAADQRPHLPFGLEAVHRPEGQQQFLQKAAVRLGVGALVDKHLQAAGFQQCPLGGKDCILAPGQAVMGMHQQNPPGQGFMTWQTAHLPPQNNKIRSVHYTLLPPKRKALAGFSGPAEHPDRICEYCTNFGENYEQAKTTYVVFATTSEKTVDILWAK